MRPTPTPRRDGPRECCAKYVRRTTSGRPELRPIRGELMERRTFVTVAVGSLIAAPMAAEAQRRRKVWQMGFLGITPPSAGPSPTWDAFVRGLREHGYVEDQNLRIEQRYSEGRTERCTSLALELVNANVDVLVTVRTPATTAARQATATIPIVMVAVGDPVGAHLVDSLGHPGGNVTGLSTLNTELGAKRLDLFKQALPKMSHVTVLWNPENVAMQLRYHATQSTARALGVALQSLPIRGSDDFGAAFAAMTKHRPESLLVMADTVTSANTHRIVEFTTQHRVPSFYEAREFVDYGGLMSYGADLTHQFWRAAWYVDRIFKGTKPADLPVEQPTEFELVINLKTAKALRLKIPQALLQRADEVLQ